MGSEYYLNPCEFFSWLARSCLSSRPRLAEAKTTAELSSGEPPPSVEKNERKESRI